MEKIKRDWLAGDFKYPYKYRKVDGDRNGAVDVFLYWNRPVNNHNTFWIDGSVYVICRHDYPHIDYTFKEENVEIAQINASNGTIKNMIPVNTQKKEHLAVLRYFGIKHQGTYTATS